MVNEFMKNILKNIDTKYYLVLCMILFLIPVIVLGFYNHPYFDDYSYSIDTYKVIQSGGGLISLIKSAFLTSYQFMYEWQGLYSSAVLLALQPGIFGDNYYFITTIFMIVVLWIGIFCLFYNLNKYIIKSKTNKYVAFLSLLTLFFLVETVPNARECLYWYNGAINYLFFWSLLLIIVGLILKYVYLTKNNIFFVMALSFLCFVLSGGNHVTAFGGLMLEFLAIIIFFKKKNGKMLIFPFLSGIIGFLININSPGTKVRAETVNLHGDVLKTIYDVFLKSFELYSNWLSIPLILFLIIFVGTIFSVIKNKKIKYRKKFLLIPFISYIVLSGMMCVVYYVFSNFGGGRVYDTLYFSFVIFLVINITILLKYLYDRRILLIDKIKFTDRIYIVFIVFIGVLGNNFYYFSTSYEATKELINGEAIKYDNQVNERLKILEDDKIDKVVVEPLKVKPYLLYGADFCEITDDNECNSSALNKYYDKKVIGVKNDKNK